ncbi:MAG: histidine kinase [Erysipelotrichaceae bacterium]|nr:histidine kinase [Erysipelotrichaceae bacterium]
MINRRLTAVNILIVTVCLMIVTFSAFFALQFMFYRENAIIYNQLFNESCEDFKIILDDAQRYSLRVCASDEVQQLLKTEHTNEQFLEKVETINNQNTLYQISIMEIVNGIVNDPAHNRIEPFDAYDYGYDYNWKFRPERQDVLRVSRVIYDLDDITKPIGIAQIDISTTVADTIIYAFENYVYGKNYLLLCDENGNRLLPYYLPKDINVDFEDTVSSLTDIPFELNRDSFTVRRTLSNNNWVLYGYIDRSSLLYGAADITRPILWAGGILTVLAAVLTYFITKRITRPVLDLSDEVQKTAESKEYEHLEIPHNVTGEVASLYRSYNNLIDEVNASFKEVQEVSRKQVDQQFMMLQAQINPHFLYNTLNTISWMAKNNQNEDIDKMVVSLVRMFRNSINNNNPLITVDGEIEHVSSYLNIMQYRYPNRYIVEYNIADETKDLYITKQILQPLAENALNHGFLEADMQGKITINSYIDDEDLVLEVCNTGSPIDMEKIQKLLANDPELSQKHYGIRNVNDRLTNYYGTQSGLHYSWKDGVTTVSMRLPLDKLMKEG